MEEILASIRRIISEDDAPQDEAATATASPATVEAAEEPVSAPEPVAAAAPEPYVAPAVEADRGDEVLDLTERVEASVDTSPSAPVESLGDLDVFRQPEPAPRAPESKAEPAWSPTADSDSLVSAPTARSAASSFDQLASSLFMPHEGRTLEDVVQELLRPLLKSWLDENLPAIVQAKVEAEVERIARSRVR